MSRDKVYKAYRCITPLADIAADVGPMMGVLLPPSDIWGNSALSGNVGVSSPRPSRTTMDPRLLSRLVQVWHVRSIQLVGHIWGEYKWQVRALAAGPSSSAVSSSLTAYSYLLPESLRFLLWLSTLCIVPTWAIEVPRYLSLRERWWPNILFIRTELQKGQRLKHEREKLSIK